MRFAWSPIINFTTCICICIMKNGHISKSVSMKTDVLNVFLLIDLFTMRMFQLISVLLLKTHDEMWQRIYILNNQFIDSLSIATLMYSWIYSKNLLFICIPHLSYPCNMIFFKMAYFNANLLQPRLNENGGKEFTAIRFLKGRVHYFQRRSFNKSYRNAHSQ